MPQGSSTALSFVIAALLIFGAQQAKGQSRGDTFHGTVRSTGGELMGGAEVIVTRAPDFQAFRTLSDSAGRYRLTVQSSSGDYLLHVSARGMQPIRRRLTRVGAADTVFVAEIVLLPTRSSTVLDAVRIAAERPSPKDFDVNTGSADGGVSNVAAAVHAGERGDLAAMAGTLPQMVRTSIGATLPGLTAEQNTVTLNGLSFAGSEVPRDAFVSTKIAFAPFDPARGGFVGAETQVDLMPGGLYAWRRISGVTDAGAAAGTGPVGSRTLRVQNSVLGAGGAGYTARDHLSYSYALQVSRRTTLRPSVSSLDPDDLRQLGVSPDSAARMRTVLETLGLRVTDGQGALAQHDQQSSIIVRVGTPPVDAVTQTAPRHNVGAVIYAANSNTDRFGSLPSSLSSTALVRGASLVSVQAYLLSLVGTRAYVESRLGWSVNTQLTRPTSDMPHGDLTLSSVINDTAFATTRVGFGGAFNGDVTRRTSTVESTTELRLVMPRWPAHKLRAFIDFKADALARTAHPGGGGAFRFQNLADLAANRPVSYTRALGSVYESASVFDMAGAVADYFRPTRSLEVMSGVRVDVADLAAPLPANGSVVSTLGASMRRTTSDVLLSPRFSVNWSPRGDRSTPVPVSADSRLGQLSMPRLNIVRAGFGAFRPWTLLDALATVRGNSEVHGTAVLSCVGDGTPIPDWRGFRTGAVPTPSACRSGSQGPSAAPLVRMLDGSYRRPVAWRLNSAYSTSIMSMIVTVEALKSWNEALISHRNINFVETPRFISAIDHRSVYVPASTILASGVVDPSMARRNSSFSDVIGLGSLGRAISRQYTISVAPDLRTYTSGVYAALSYTQSHTDERVTGLDGSTDGNPNALGWQRAATDARHVIVGQFAYTWQYVTASVFGKFSSGRPFTPLIGEDVNGDGVSNDIAFVPSRVALGAVGDAAAVQDLWATAQRHVRACLLQNAGRVAMRNSCEGPRSVSVNAQVAFDMGRTAGFARRLSGTVSFVNPLGALDQLVNGAHVRGWGDETAPDPVLLHVRSFDAARGEFDYTVNPRFGSTRPTAAGLRTPARIVIEIRINTGEPVPVQQLARALSPGRAGHPGVRVSAAQLRTRFARQAPNPYRFILSETDSLLLTTSQVRRLVEARDTLQRRLDRIFDAVATSLANLPDSFDAGQALRAQEQANDEAWNASREDLQAMLPQILSPMQLTLLPGLPRELLRARSPLHGMRYFGRTP